MPGRSSLRILLIIRHELFLRLIEPWIRTLVERGDALEIGITCVTDATKMDEAARRSIIGDAQIGRAPLSKSLTARATLFVRLLQDYLRYFDPIYDDCDALRRRAAAPIPGFFRILFSVLGAQRDGPRWRLISALRWVDKMLPCDPAVKDFLAQRTYDVLLVTPLVDPTSGECEYLKCAIERGDKTALIVASWDNLTNKGLIQFTPDKIFVWNPLVAKEAEELHRILSDKLVVTGAPVFDPWFVMQPSTSREEFCAKLGLDPSKPILLYLCSSKFVAPDEVASIRSWIAKIRSHPDAAINQANVLIRPHPGNPQAWDQLEARDQVVVWPLHGEQVVDAESRSRYFNSLHHCAVVVAINTSAMIEAAIVGRPVLMLSDTRSHLTQEGTLHFRHLLKGGLLHPVTSDAEHFRRLGEFLSGKDAGKGERERFVLDFVRPLGRAVEPASAGVQALDTLCARD